MSDLTFSDDAWRDYLYWQTQDRKTLKRINLLIQSIQRDGPANGLGKPEALKYAGVLTRKIAFSTKCTAKPSIFRPVWDTMTMKSKPPRWRAPPPSGGGGFLPRLTGCVGYCGRFAYCLTGGGLV